MKGWIMEIKIGMKYIPRSDKQKRVHTVIDCYKTYNSKGELVNTTYVSVHDFCGQQVKTHGVVQPTIARGLINEE